MADIVNSTPNVKNGAVLDLARLIDEHKGQDTLALFIGEISSWTDYFIISTVQSTGHLRGLLRIIQEYLDEHQIEAFHRYKNSEVAEEGWVLIDCGSFLIHLMRKDTREFYDLERLWFAGDVVYGEI